MGAERIRRGRARRWGRPELEPFGEGVHAGVVDGAPGDDYVFVLDGGAGAARSVLAPPAGRAPRPVAGRRHLPLRDRRRGPALPLEELVLYELHVGTFTREGTFDAAIPRLARLRELGVTAIELMPVATFPGERGWGYDGIYLSRRTPRTAAPKASRASSTPRTAKGSAVILDVVYNHIGPGSEAIARVRAVLHRPPRDVLGRRDRLLAARRARVGDPERRAVDARLPDRRPAPRRRARDLRRLAGARAARAAASASTGS